MTKPKRSDGTQPGAGAAYLGSVLGLIDSADPDLSALQAKLDAHPIDARELLGLVAALRLGDESSRQRERAEKGHRTRKMAMLWVADLWSAQGKYNGASKKAFSERVADEVLEKFGVNVKPKTVESRWLTPAIVDAAMLGKGLPQPADAVAYADGRMYYAKPTKNKSRNTIKISNGKN